ncbi:MAG: hypothetical protein ACYC3V_19500 [Chloroflexota bacterium]
MHSSLIGKIQKANLYAQEPDRVSFQQFSATFRGEHDSYAVSFSQGVWKCSCNFFASWGVCSHTMTIQRLLGVMLPRQEAQSVEQPAEAVAQA